MVNYMRKYKITLVIILSVIILLGIIFGSIDYNKIKSGKKPIFMIRITDGSQVIQEYIGLGYRMQRSVGIKEELYQDNYVKFGLWFYLREVKVDKPKFNYEYKIKVNENNLCDKEQLYYEGDDYNIYTYCINSITIYDGNSVKSLKDMIVENNNIIDKIISELIPKDTIYDGGTTIYKDGGTKKIASNGLTIIKCNTLDGNRDIYIGADSLEFQDNFCKG